MFDSDAAVELIREMEQAMKAIQDGGRFDTDRQRQDVLDIYREGIEILKQRWQ